MRLLLTAFEPYDIWKTNSSWEVLIELLKHRGSDPNIITRRYPVDLTSLQSRLDRDLSQGIDAVLHLGQAPGISQIHLESIAVNVAGMTTDPIGDYEELMSGGPVAYRTDFPLGTWRKRLYEEGIPSTISYHAGTYLCNAAMFLSHHWFARRGEKANIGFVHLPLIPEQIIDSGKALPCTPKSELVRAVETLINTILLKESETRLA